MIPHAPFMVRIRRKTSPQPGGGRMQEDRWFESHGAAVVCFNEALKQPLVSGVTIMMVLDEATKDNSQSLSRV